MILILGSKNMAFYNQSEKQVNFQENSPSLQNKVEKLAHKILTSRPAIHRGYPLHSIGTYFPWMTQYLQCDYL